MTLELGNYHFVADADTLVDEPTGQFAGGLVGMKFVSLGATTAENEDIASGSISGFDLRLHEFLKIEESQTLIVSVEPSAAFSLATNCTLGIFNNGTAVPTPFVERCLPVTTLSTDS